MTILRAPPKEITQLQKKLAEWKPKYNEKIELPAAKIYVALKEGKLGAKGILLPHVDRETALNALDREGRTLSDLQDIEIPRGFWSEREIFWELSAARNHREHYCQIHCDTEEVLSLFPPVSGAPVTAARFGSFFVVEGLGAGGRVTKKPATQPRRPGRSQQYPWENVYHEIASLIHSGRLPKKKEACISYVQNWFTSQNLSPPSRAAIGEKLTPYYNRFVRSAGQKTARPIGIQRLDGAV